MSLDRQVVLTVDDDTDLGSLIAAHLRRWGYDAPTVDSAAALWPALDERPPDAILMDVMLGDADGSQLVLEVKRQLPDVPVIMITRSNSVEAAVACMKHGAADYITKPLDFERLAAAVEEGLRLRRLADDMRRPRTPRRDSRLPRLIGDSPAMIELVELVSRVGPADVSVLILGETGTGKELIARSLHELSSRADGPFVPVNAAALPHELIESALFGHEKGAFTGAQQDHVGFCEQADGGTLFLDEIGEMSFEVQAKLLRFLQDHVVQRVGARSSCPVDVRVLAATNIDPAAQIAAGRLREDLFYRLRVVSVELPPLRERGDDVLLLARHFLRRAGERHGRQFNDLAEDAQAVLLTCDWPGNVRQLENAIEESAVLNDGVVLTAAMLPAALSAPAAAAGGGSEEYSASEREEKRRLTEALLRSGRDPEAAARELGISRATVYRKIKKYRLAR